MIYFARAKAPLTALLLAVSSANCGSSTGPVNNGQVRTYTLNRALGKQLPVDLGDVDPRFGGTGCRRLLSDGELILDDRLLRFQLEYRTLSSCGLRVVSHDKSSGLFEAARDTVILIEQSSGGLVHRWQLRSSASEQTLIGQVHALEMEFRLVNQN